MTPPLVAAFTELLTAARKVPIARNDGPHGSFTCIGCGRGGSRSCKKECWVPRFENAISAAGEELAAARRWWGSDRREKP